MIPSASSEIDAIAIAIARALAKKHHADSIAPRTQTGPAYAHRDLRPIQQRAAKR